MVAVVLVLARLGFMFGFSHRQIAPLDTVIWDTGHDLEIMLRSTRRLLSPSSIQPCLRMRHNVSNYNIVVPNHLYCTKEKRPACFTKDECFGTVHFAHGIISITDIDIAKISNSALDSLPLVTNTGHEGFRWESKWETNLTSCTHRTLDNINAE